jgi:uncharacterized membrane protein YcaP (DUF421 family)
MQPFNWQEIWAPKIAPLEVIFRALVVYLFVLFLFRLLGRKEWTRYAVFNVVVLFLIAVALRTTMLGEDSSVTSGILSVSTILFVDWLFSYLSFRNDRIADLLQGKVIPLVQNGKLQASAMRKARISESQLLEQVRLKGYSSLDEVEEASLERSGHVSFRFKSVSS